MPLSRMSIGSFLAQASVDDYSGTSTNRARAMSDVTSRSSADDSADMQPRAAPSSSDTPLLQCPGQHLTRRRSESAWESLSIRDKLVVRNLMVSVRDWQQQRRRRGAEDDRIQGNVRGGDLPHDDRRKCTREQFSAQIILQAWWSSPRLNQHKLKRRGHGFGRDAWVDLDNVL